MRIGDVFWLSYKDLGEKKVRTALTILMVMIGVASIIALVSQTAGISASIQNQLQSLGPTSIILTSTRSAGFTIADTSALSQLQNVSAVIPLVTGQATMIANNQNFSVTLIGISPQYLQLLLGNFSFYEGSAYEDSIAPSTVVGYSIAFPSTSSGNQNVQPGSAATLKITSFGGASSYTVPIVGILPKYGSSIIGNIDSSAIVSLQAAEALLHRSSFSMVLVKASSTASVTALSDTLTQIYGNNARVMNIQTLAQTASSIIGSITLLLIVIAGISLLVAAIGIMNIMLMAVLERTHEIGILKSLGFRNEHILEIFLLQALIIGFIGGMLGIALGSGASYSLAYVLTHAQTSNTTTSTSAGATGFGPEYRSTSSGSARGGGSFSGPAAATSQSTFSYTPLLTLQTIGEAMIVAVLVSAIAGIYPAWRASRMEPIDALRQL